MTPEDIPSLPRGVRLHFDRLRDTWVLLAPERAVTLDQTGHAVPSRVDGTRNLGQIVRDLAATYNAPEDQIAGDSAAFLAAMRDRLFLDVKP